MPKISVVIPTKNRSALLAETIDRVESQTIPGDHYEVLVIDNASTDDTRAILEQKAGIYPNLKFDFQKKPGAAATRNVGIRLANSDLILFIDDECRPSLRWFRQILSAISGIRTRPCSDQ